MIATAWPFIELDDQGVPFIKGTRTKATELVAEHLAYHWDTDQLHIQHPHLSLPQIHAALGYYYEHREECDRQIEEGLRRADELRTNMENPDLQARLPARSGFDVQRASHDAKPFAHAAQPPGLRGAKGGSDVKSLSIVS